MTRCWKTNLAESLQCQKSAAIDLTKFLIGLQIREICLRLKTFGALWLQLFMPDQSRRHWWHTNVIFRNLQGQFLCLLCTISLVFIPRSNCWRGLGDRNFVCLSISLSVFSVCHTHALWWNERTYFQYFGTTWKGTHSSFLTPTAVGGWCPLSPEICA